MKRKINSIDILIALGILVLLFGAYKYMSRSQVDDGFIISSDHRVSFMVETDKLPLGMGERIHVGDQLVASGRYQDAYVTDVSIADSKEVIASGGAFVEVVNPTKELVRVTVDAKVNKYGPYRDLSGQEIKAGLDFWFKTDEVVTLTKIVQMVEEEN
ncbi:MAG: hypothetical protein CVU95_01685 [Firmicutes bacterium HGW-Firmicutes-2]|jgi:hypothetical protein|nr:MAG: hypothetical protein CVU95_01685 [Firmicutes bacterium HGW-Firmicutes-2]